MGNFLVLLFILKHIKGTSLLEECVLWLLDVQTIPTVLSCKSEIILPPLKI